MMSSPEHALLSDLFARLRDAERQPRDAEAEGFVRDAVAAQPAAPYYMAQTILVQQQALAAAHARIAELERRAGSGSGGFPAGGPAWAANPWDRAAAGPARRGTAGPDDRWSAGGGYGGYGGAPHGGAYPTPGGGGRGGFLSGALQTAAGVAGGILAAGAISSLLSGAPGPFGEALAADGGETAAGGGLRDAEPAAAPAEDAHGTDPNYVADEFDGGDFGGGDFGGGADGGDGGGWE